ncbi:MAG: MFS transporter [Candidatus Sericytochromatia bacterium]
MLTLAAIQFTHIMDFMILMPLGPQLMRLFGISTVQFGLLVSAYTFSAGLSGFLSSFVMDRFDRKRVLVVLYAGFVLGTLACALAPAYEVLLAARILTGAFGGVLAAVTNAVVGDAIPMERRGTAMGFVTASFSAASVFGVPFGLFLASRFSWHAPFLFLVAAGISVMALIVRSVPVMTQHMQTGHKALNPLEVMQQAVSSPAQRHALLLTVLMMLSQFAIIPFLSPSMVANVGFSEADLTWIYLLGGGITLFTGPQIGRLADRLGKFRVLVVFLLLSIIPQLLITHLGPTPIALVLLLTTSFFIVSGGRMIPAMALITGTVEPRNRGSFMGIQSALQQVAAGVASLVAAQIVVKDVHGHLLHYEKVGYLSAAASLLCIWAAWRMSRAMREQGRGVRGEGLGGRQEAVRT